jgi:tetratricopeptide (TPR) repeat protein
MLSSAAFSATPQELLASGHVDELIQVLQKDIDRSAANAETYNLVCRAYFQIDDWDHAIPECERAVALDPQKSVYHLWLGRAYGEKADHSSFITAAGLAKRVRISFERAVELDPNNVDARADLGEFYAEAPGIVGGGKDKARSQAQALMSINPAMSHWVSARVDEKEKQPAAAEKSYRAAVEASHSGARAWLDLAIFYRYAQRFNEMDAALKKMQSSTLDRPESLMHAASLLLRANHDLPGATRLLKQYLDAPVEQGPACKAHDLLGQLLEKQGDRQAAAQEFRAALALAHNYVHAQDDLKRVDH